MDGYLHFQAIYSAGLVLKSMNLEKTHLYKIVYPTLSFKAKHSIS